MHPHNNAYKSNKYLILFYEKMLLICFFAMKTGKQAKEVSISMCNQVTLRN